MSPRERQRRRLVKARVTIVAQATALAESHHDRRNIDQVEQLQHHFAQAAIAIAALEFEFLLGQHHEVGPRIFRDCLVADVGRVHLRVDRNEG